MTIGIEDIKKIKPGRIEPLPCDPDKMYAVATALSTLKRRGKPDDVVDYEHEKFFELGIVLIHAMREGDTKVLNR